MSLPLELEKVRDEIKAVAEGFGLDFFDTIFEMVNSDQINSLAALGGFPVRYPHWRFGMDYDQLSKGYEWGMHKIYEMVINTDPSYAYLVTSNPLVDQKLVMSHVYGHVDFFKNNYWFSKTNRKMLDTMANHAVKIRGYMDRYGQDNVENFIDRCLSIENLIDPYLPFNPRKADANAPASLMGSDKKETEEEKKVRSELGRLKVNRSYMDEYINPKEFLDQQQKKMKKTSQQSKRNPSEPQKDVLLFLLDNAPLEDWEHEVLSIVRDEDYYFVPQMQTKIMNEGWASYWHSKIMTGKILKDSEVIDFAERHSGAMTVSPNKLNPYKLGIELFRDIEDRWNRGRFGKEYDECDNLVVKANWNKDTNLGKQKIFEVRKIYNDITFIDDFLTQDFVERNGIFTFEFNRRTNRFEIASRDFIHVKEKLLQSLTNLGQPFIYVKDGNYENRGELLLWHKHEGVDLDINWAQETMKNLSEVWRRPVCIETLTEGVRKVYTYNRGEFSEKNL
jgi:stage V sporulation protein R